MHANPTRPLLDDSFPLPLALPFTATQAAAAGISRSQLRRLYDEGLIRRLLRNVYVAAQTPDSRLLRARALQLVVPVGSVVTDWSALWLYTGITQPGGHRGEPVVTMFRFDGHDRLRNALCESGKRTLIPEDIWVVEGLLVTSPLRTAWDLGRLAPRDWAIGALDALLRHGTFTKVELLAGIERFKGMRGVVQLRELAPLADPRADSPGESVLRLRWLETSLPPPTPQVPIVAESGAVVYWIDLGVPELRFGCEYDGEEFHTSDADREHDRLRREELADRWDWDVQGVTKENVFGRHRDIERILHDGIRDARKRLGSPVVR